MANTPIHPEGVSFRTGIKDSISYYCETCKIMFLSTADVVDYHSLSVEHMTIKCFDTFGIKPQMNRKEITLSKQTDKNKNDNGPPAIKNDFSNYGIKLPMIVLNRYKCINGLIGECKYCATFIIWDIKTILNHLLTCVFKCNLTGSNKTTVRAFKCTMCDYSTNTMNGHKAHITSYLHITNCYKSEDYYSYICKVCNVFMYSHRFDIMNHLKIDTDHRDIVGRKLPILSIFMARTFKEFNKYPNIVETIHFDSDPERDISTNVSKTCVACKIKFNNPDDYNMHAITSEHIILKYLMPKKYEKNPNTLKRKTYRQSTVPPVIQDSSVLQIQNNSMPIDNDANNNIQNIQLNECKSL